MSSTPTAAARVEAAEAVRRLIHALAAHDGDVETLSTVAAEADRLTDAVTAAPQREPGGDLADLVQRVAEGEALHCSPHCMVSGVAHPASSGAVGRREGDDAVLDVTLARAHEGMPGIVHGGMVASLFDEAMGFAMWMEDQPGMTAWLRIDYRAPVPIDVPLEFRAGVVERDGRKRFMAGTARADGEVVAEAEALFVVPRRQG